MIELRTLGESGLRSTADGRSIRSVLAQPKRFALLVHLAVENPSGFTRRDALLPLFWPDFAQDRARAALRKSLYHLRRSLGNGVVVGRGDEEVGIDPERLWCDVTAFGEAREQGRPEDALELYGGTFLPGFHLSGSPGFEKWLDGVRQRLRREAAETARRLEEAARSDRAFADAAGWGRRALEIDPFDERALRRLLDSLGRAGARAEAARTWERFRTRLERELDVEPAAETRRVAGRVLTKPEPKAAPAPQPEREELPGAEAKERLEARAGGDEEPAGDGDRRAGSGGRGTAGGSSAEGAGRRRWRRDGAPGPPRPAVRGPSVRRGVAVASGLLGAAVLGWALWPAASETATGDAAAPAEGEVPERVLVVDLEAGGGDTLLADALSEVLRIGLARSPHLTVASRQMVAGVLRRMRRSPAERLTLDLAREVAVREGIGTVVGGRLGRAGTEYVIAASLVEPETGEVRDGWVETPADSSELTDAVTRLAAAVRERTAGGVSVPAAGGVAENPPLPVTTPSLAALQKYTRALRAQLAGDFLRATELAEESVALDSTFAAAHLLHAISLAAAYTSRGRELEALSRAFRLRHQLTELERYLVAGHYYRASGRLPEAVEAFRGEIEVADRLGARTWAPLWIGVVLMQTGDLGESERLLREEAAGQGFGWVDVLARVLHRTGRREEALALVRRARRDRPGHPVFADVRVELATAGGEYERADSLAASIPLGGSSGLAERHPLRLRAVNDAVRGRYGTALGHLGELRHLQLARDLREPAWNTTIFAARLHAARGAPEAAVATIEAFLERLPPDSLHPLGRPFIYLPLADFFVEVGRPDRAREFVAVYDRIVEPRYRRPSRARRLLIAAKLHGARGDTARSLEALSRALAHVRLHGQFDYDLPINVPVGDRPEVARLYAAAGLRDSALAVYERYLDNTAIRRAWLDAYELPSTLEHLAELHRAAGRAREAARLQRRLREMREEVDLEGVEPGRDAPPTVPWGIDSFPGSRWPESRTPAGSRRERPPRAP